MRKFKPNANEDIPWHKEFCNNCIDKIGCSIYMGILFFNPKDPEYPEELRYVEGKGVCTAHKPGEPKKTFMPLTPNNTKSRVYRK